jgi:hypothetical protein
MRPRPGGDGSRVVSTDQGGSRGHPSQQTATFTETRRPGRTPTKSGDAQDHPHRHFQWDPTMRVSGPDEVGGVPVNVAVRVLDVAVTMSW